jgi:hypothetical protein
MALTLECHVKVHLNWASGVQRKPRQDKVDFGIIGHDLFIL